MNYASASGVSSLRAAVDRLVERTLATSDDRAGGERGLQKLLVGSELASHSCDRPADREELQPGNSQSTPMEGRWLSITEIGIVEYGKI